MATDTLPTSLSFLTNAAHLLALSAPETSAHLTTQRNNLMLSHELPQSDIQRQHICGACGHIMVPGKESTLRLDSAKPVRKGKNAKAVQTSSKPSPARIRKQLNCGMCRRYTNIIIPSSPSAIRRARPMLGPRTTLSAAAPPIHAFEPPKASSNASSKKRAKNRKLGLQALLQQSQSSASSRAGLGLTLTDFLKK